MLHYAACASAGVGRHHRYPAVALRVDEGASENVRLQAIKDALDRGGVMAKQAVDVGVQLRPYEHLLNDIAGVAQITREESRARQGLPPDEPPALAEPEPMEIVDAELVPEPPETAAHSRARQRTPADRDDVPADEPASATRPPGRELATLEEATADAAQANRRNAARLNRVRRAR